MSKAIEMYGLAITSLEESLKDLYDEVLVEIHKAASRGEFRLDYNIEAPGRRLGIAALANQDGFRTVLHQSSPVVTFSWRYLDERHSERSE